jgi:hypothetical protein
MANDSRQRRHPTVVEAGDMHRLDLPPDHPRVLEGGASVKHRVEADVQVPDPSELLHDEGTGEHGDHPWADRLPPLGIELSAYVVVGDSQLRQLASMHDAALTLGDLEESWDVLQWMRAAGHAATVTDSAPANTPTRPTRVDDTRSRLPEDGPPSVAVTHVGGRIPLSATGSDPQRRGLFRWGSDSALCDGIGPPTPEG